MNRLRLVPQDQTLPPPDNILAARLRIVVPEDSVSSLTLQEDATMNARIKLRYITPLVMILLAIVVIAFT